MKNSSFIACVIAFYLTAGNLLADSPRERTLIDSGWRFYLGDPADITNPSETNVTYYPEISNLEKLQSGDVSGSTSETNLMTLRPSLNGLGENVSFVQTSFNDSSWRTLNLPHDWVVELPFSSGGDKGHGYKAGINGTTSTNTIAWYRRTFTLPSSYINKTLWLEFDGVYRNCLVWLNGHIIGRNVSGYSSASFDISQYANPGGTNVLVVRVDASRFEGWFYEGAGIYRHVWLVKTDPVHVAHWGTYVTNALSGSNAVVTIRTQVNNDGASSTNCNLTSSIFDASSNLVATATESVPISAGASNIVTQTLTITNARLWSLNFPNLYQLASTVTQSGVTNDIYTTPFGVRTITWDPNNGLFLNGQHIEAKGVCNHQDFEGIGLAMPDRIQYYRLERLKGLGFNAIRTSHNSPTPELLADCDQLGMLVMDEHRRLGWDPESLGQLQRDITRDRNHPSVFMWSLANEETLQGTTTGGMIMQAMTNLAHQLDPTRLCTAAMNGSWGSGFSTNVDVQGFNYHEGNESSYHSSHPNQPTIATEDGSQVGDRSIYTNLNSYVTAYDIFNSGVGWSQTEEGMLQFYSAHSFVAGFFNWTGFDYRGEPTPTSWPTISSHFGILDTCGFPKDNAWYFQANWLTKPVLHIFPHWNWAGREGQPIDIWCFSSCDTVELFLNGVSQGAKTVNIQSHLEWNVGYAAGTLMAIGSIGGQPVITNTVVTTGSPSAITLQPDRSTILADGCDVSLVTVAVVDSQGIVVPTASNSVTFTISGGTILGLGNGDPNCHQSDQPTNGIGTRSVFNGLAQVLVQSSTQPGAITLTATSAGLTSTSVIIAASSTLPVPAMPTGVVALAGQTKINVGWDVVPGALTYNLKRATTPGGPYTVIASSTADIGYVDASVVGGTTYYYVVSALNAAGESVNSAEISASLPSTGLPPGWTDADIGAVGLVGSATYNNAKFTVSGSGSDVWKTNDAFNFAYEPLNGDGTLITRVASQQNTSGWAKSGIMFRDSVAANAAYAFLMVSPSDGVSFQYRSANGVSAAQVANAPGIVAPEWLELVRSGGTFTGYYSADGSSWTQIGSASVTMVSGALAGLAVCAHNNTALNTSGFDNVSFTGNTPDFTVSATPASQTVIAGNSTSYTVTVGAANGFTGSVSPSVAGLPSGASGSFNPASVTGSGTSTLTVSTATGTTTGSFPLTITGTSGSLAHSNTVTLVVNPPPVPDFSLSASPSSLTIIQGSNGVSTITVNPLNGYTGTVSLSASGLPSGVTDSFNPSSTTGTSTLTLTASSTATIGTSTITITGTDGTLTHTTTISLTVNPTVSFSGIYQIQNEASGLVLNNQGRLTNNAPITQWKVTTSSNLDWTFIATSNGYYQINSAKSGLDAVVQGASTANGAGIVQWSFGSSGDDQWQPQQNSDGSYTFVNLHSGLVLEDPGSSTNTSTQMDQWSSNGGSNQKWNLLKQ